MPAVGRFTCLSLFYFWTAQHQKIFSQILISFFLFFCLRHNHSWSHQLLITLFWIKCPDIEKWTDKWWKSKFSVIINLFMRAILATDVSNGDHSSLLKKIYLTSGKTGRCMEKSILGRRAVSAKTQAGADWYGGGAAERALWLEPKVWGRS